MSTKRSLLPLTQNVPLFTVGQLPDGKPTTKVVSHGETKYSNEIFRPSEHSFAAIGIKYVVDASSNGTATITIKIEYKVPRTDQFSDAITIATLSEVSDVVTGGKMYRLDAVLNINWIPNVPFRISFTVSAAGSDNVTFEGAYIV